MNHCTCMLNLVYLFHLIRIGTVSLTELLRTKVPLCEHTKHRTQWTHQRTNEWSRTSYTQYRQCAQCMQTVECYDLTCNYMRVDCFWYLLWVQPLCFRYYAKFYEKIKSVKILRTPLNVRSKWAKFNKFNKFSN